ncbi:MAG: NAD(P)/FAD-dependent oxidoreductase [Gemmatimonadetes bacterium]|nr:NAD(P)/FAD-dependent oxidoreductase [Gemmatimonadota bacterium]
MSSEPLQPPPDRTVARPHVVILGGGFAGLHCARALRRAPVDVTLVDRRNYHLFQPLLYQVATASLSPADIASPIRSILKRVRNVQVWLGEAIGVDVENRVVELKDGRLEYDYLVVATGVTHAYFGHEEWAGRAPGLKTVDDALEIRRRFLLAFEAAEREADPASRRRLLTFVIVGAGPTGVELAGSMVEIARQSIPRDFRFIDTASARVILVEGADRVLPGYPPDLSASARRQLERLGVEVRTGAIVTDIGEGVHIGEEVIPAGNVYWAAGVAASPLAASLDAPLDRSGRVLVESDCSVPRHPEVFVLGDLAHIQQDGEPLPGVAQVAIQSGRHAGRMIRYDLARRPREPFRYRFWGNLATIGRAAAVADFGRVRFGGYLAWLVWVFVHILKLIGFRNRILVMIQWAWAWLTYQRGIRLITGSPEVQLERSRSSRDA